MTSTTEAFFVPRSFMWHKIHVPGQIVYYYGYGK